MKQYSTKDFRNLRSQPTQNFVQTMESLLNRLPSQLAGTIAARQEMRKEKPLLPSYPALIKALLAAAAVLLMTGTIWAVRYSQRTPPADLLVRNAETSSISENKESILTALDRIDIRVEPDLLWNSETGILAEGDSIVKSSGQPYRNATYRVMSELGASAEGEIAYTSSANGTVFRQRIRLRLGTGYYAMDMPQKSLQIDALDGAFEYPLFEDRLSTAYSSFLLRNAGNDCLFTRIADGIQSRLIDRYPGTDLLTLAWKPVNVYINGEYWGIYNMRESLDAETICRHEEVSTDLAPDITILKLGGTAIQGSSKEYRQLLDVVLSGDPDGSEEDRATLEANFDIDSYLDWLAVKTFFGDTDAASTFVCYRVPGQKWKCLAQGFDYGLFRADYDALNANLKMAGMGAANGDNALFRKMLEVPAYREMFIRKLEALYRAFTTDAMQQMLDECVSLIEPEMDRHLARWAPFNESTLNMDAPTDPGKARKYWESRIQRMREWTMVNRPRCVFEHVQRYFGLTDQEMAKFNKDNAP